MRKIKSVKLKGICYVLVRTNAIHSIAHKRHSLMWYPETAMSLLQRVKYRPWVQSVVTECPWIIACYDRDNVRVWNDERGWISPNHQTYGADVSHITHHILKIRQSIPSTPLDGGEEIDKLTAELEESYDRSR